MSRIVTLDYRHYVGYTESEETLPQRLQHHERGTGARLMRALSLAGIGYKIAMLIPDGDRTQERRLKARKNTPRWCPVCREERRKIARKRG